MRVYDGLTLAQMARQYGPECLELLVKVMRDESLPPLVRQQAVDRILDRGYGKATLHIETGARAIESLTTAELEAIARGEQPRTPLTFEGVPVTALTTAYSVEDSAT